MTATPPPAGSAAATAAVSFSLSLSLSRGHVLAAGGRAQQPSLGYVAVEKVNNFVFEYDGKATPSAASDSSASGNTTSSPARRGDEAFVTSSSRLLSGQWQDMSARYS